MRKFLLVAVVAIFLSGCSLFNANPYQVSSMTFEVGDEVLTLVPNYSDSILAVTLSGTDYDNTGDVGEEYFGSFEEVVTLFHTSEYQEFNVKDGFEDDGNVHVSLLSVGGEAVARFSLSWEEDLPNIEKVNSFYLSLFSFFSADVY